MTDFKVGDEVEIVGPDGRINDDFHTESTLYWSDSTRSMIGKVFIINEIDCDGDILIDDEGGDGLYFDPEWVSKIEGIPDIDDEKACRDRVWDMPMEKTDD